MRSTSPSKSDYTLSKFPPSKIRNMNKEEYAHQRNVVLDKHIPTNHVDYPDQQVATSKSPDLNMGTSNIQNSMRQTSNYESLYIQEQQSKR